MTDCRSSVYEPRWSKVVKVPRIVLLKRLIEKSGVTFGLLKIVIPLVIVLLNECHLDVSPVYDSDSEFCLWDKMYWLLFWLLHVDGIHIFHNLNYTFISRISLVIYYSIANLVRVWYICYLTVWIGRIGERSQVLFWKRWEGHNRNE